MKQKIPRDRLLTAIDSELCTRCIFESYKEPDGSWDSYKVANFILERIERELLLHLVDENLGYTVVRDKDKEDFKVEKTDS